MDFLKTTLTIKEKMYYNYIDLYIFVLKIL